MSRCSLSSPASPTPSASTGAHRSSTTRSCSSSARSRASHRSSALLIEVEEAYTHCSKAFLRSQLWDPERYVDRSELPSPGALLKSVGAEVEPDTYDAERAERYERREGFY